MQDLLQAAWPAARLGEAVELLAREAGLEVDAEQALPAAPDGAGPGAVIEAASSLLGLEAEPIEVRHDDFEALLRSAPPAILQAPGAPARFWAIASGGGRRVTLIAPDGARHRVDGRRLRLAFLSEREAEAQAGIASLLARAQVPPRRLERARAILLREWVGGRVAGGCWLLRPAPHTPLRRHLAAAGAPRHLLRFALASVADFLLLLLGWAWVGRATLHGQLDGGWLAGWGLLLATSVPLRAVAAGAAVRASVTVGVVMKQRLLAGTLRIDPEELRRDGAGSAFARVLQAEAVESLALSGGLSTAMAALQLLLAIPVLAAGAGGGALVVLLLALAAAGALAIRAEWRARRRAAAAGLDLTHDLVERMIGHRTRKAQEPPAQRHEAEDQLLHRYQIELRRSDAAGNVTAALLPRAWLLAAVSLVGLSVMDGAAGPDSLAVAAGGILLCAQSIRQLGAGLVHLMGAGIAWRGVKALFRAAAEPEPAAAGACTGGGGPPATLEAHALAFRFPSRPEPVLRGAAITARPGARLLLEGPSGGGKSALASVLAGLRRPESGLLLLGGADPATVGLGDWRRRVAYAPQFHENHLLAGSLAFNLLMGRGWPASPPDVQEAEEVCRELGLGPLLDRMPSGIHQAVGETGWQLSHGERSRVFLARGLLQRPDVLILDESFAALDPETAAQALRAVLARAGTLIVIAHP